jgi:hypothetical protein
MVMMGTAIAILIGFSAVSAQRGDGGPSPEKTDRHVALLKERLDLSDRQAQEIRSIIEESQKQAEAKRGKYVGNPEAARKFREEHRQATDEKIKGVFNEDQKREYEKIKDKFRREISLKDREGKGGSRPGQGGPGGNGGVIGGHGHHR